VERNRGERDRRGQGNATLTRGADRPKTQTIIDRGDVAHYHGERNHQGVDNRLLVPVEEPMRSANSNAPVERRERLGGLLNFYYRCAA
jgi:hypothetical protein